MHSSPLTRKSSIGIEDVDEDDDNGISPCTHAVTPEQDLVLVEGSENGDDEGHTPTGEDSECHGSARTPLGTHANGEDSGLEESRKAIRT
jgi:hypothetical protein